MRPQDPIVRPGAGPSVVHHDRGQEECAPDGNEPADYRVRHACLRKAEESPAEKRSAGARPDAAPRSLAELPVGIRFA